LTKIISDTSVLAARRSAPEQARLVTRDGIPVPSQAPVRPPEAPISEFERQYYTFFCVPPHRLCKYLNERVGEEADKIMQRDPRFIVQKYYNIYDPTYAETWSDLPDSEDDSDFSLYSDDSDGTLEYDRTFIIK